jgi:hypothetical protein
MAGGHSMPSTPSIFIIYRRSDTSWVALAINLQVRLRFPRAKLFLDIVDIKPGRDYMNILRESVQNAAVLFALMGRHWLAAQDEGGRRRLDLDDDWVRIEIGTALVSHVLVVPVLVDGAQMPKDEYLPDVLKPLTRRQSVHIKYESIEDDIKKLMDIIADTYSASDTAETKVEDSEPDQKNSDPADFLPGGMVAELLTTAVTDEKTLLIIAEDMLGQGRFGLSANIFRAVANRQLTKNGYEDIDFQRTRYMYCRAIILLKKYDEAEEQLLSTMRMVAHVYDESYPLYYRARLALVRAKLEQGKIEEARQHLSEIPTGVLFADQSRDLLRAWIADGDRQASYADKLLGGF